MARARNLKPGFFRNADLVELPFHTRLLFAGLWTLADRTGRLEDRPKQIKMDIFPADDVNVDAAISELAATGMLIRYEVEGKPYIEITNFLKHQNPHKAEKESSIPPPGGFKPNPEPPIKGEGTDPPNPPMPLSSGTQHSASTVQTPDQAAARPVPVGLTPDPLSLDSLSPETHNPQPAAPAPVDNSGATDAGGVCCVLQAAKIGDADPADPVFLALLQKGASVATFRTAAQTAVNQGNPRFAYVLGIVRNKMQQAAAVVSAPMAVPVAALPGARVDVSRMTVPAKPGPDPELARIAREDKKAAPMPPTFRAWLSTVHVKPLTAA